MPRVYTLTLAVLLAVSMEAGARESQATIDLLKKGSGLSAQDAVGLEDRVAAKPNDEEVLLQLLAYDTFQRSVTDLSSIQAARLNHILWIIEHDPHDGFGLFQVGTGVYQMHCTGDELADPAGFKQVSEAWQQQVRKYPADAAIRQHAVETIQYCAPEDAEKILLAQHDRASLGRLYATASLRVTGRSYAGNDPVGADPSWREKPFAATARHALETANDKEFLAAAAVTLLRDGGILWADGKLDWDYTPLGSSLLAKAKELAPEDILLWTAQPTRPARGERPPITVRVGGTAMSKNLTRQVPPHFPPEARQQRTTGTVQLDALIGPDGSVVFLHAAGGPPVLIPASVDAVRQLRYKPTTVGGKACYVLTRIDVNYTLN